MYVYLPHSSRNRLAREGEELVVQRLDIGSLAFVSTSDLQRLRQKPDSIWADFLDCVLFRKVCISTVSIPRGAHLLLYNVPVSLQKSLEIAEQEEVVFSEIFGTTYSYRDALILPDQTKVLIQDLCEGIQATVLSVSSGPSGDKEELRLAFQK